jgi:O-methyltransferase
LPGFKQFRRWRKKHLRLFRPEYEANGLAVKNRNLGFLDDPRFRDAWDFAAQGNREGWPRGIPNIEWRAHFACWAGAHALTIEGDFVECGVHTGLLSMTVCRFLRFAEIPRSFWLFDTFAGIPADRLPEDERAAAEAFNRDVYFDCWALATRNFESFPNARLVRGVLPDSLAGARIGRIAYLSVDLNSASAEGAVIEALWDRLSPGAVVLIDDYAFKGHEAQYEMWNGFAEGRGRMIATLPTGQGLLIR